MKLVPFSTNSHTSDTHFMVSDEDYEKVIAYKWYVQRANYKDKKPYLRILCSQQGNAKVHRFILGITDPKIIIDHIDGNTFNNTRENLRVAAHRQNMRNLDTNAANTSGYKGVYPNSKVNKWVAQICVDYKNIYLGYFSSKEEAARAYDRAALNYFGKFAKLNFKREDYA